MSKNVISCIVYDGAWRMSWLLSVTYGPHNRRSKLEFWGSLRVMASRFDGPWLVIGDFNAVLCSSERVGGRVRDPLANYVLEAMDNLGMIELNISRREFSWRNRREVRHIHSKIDRGLANVDWWSLFPEASLCYLPETVSDHKPLLLHTSPQDPFTRKPFRFEAMCKTRKN
ncbi:hypothetical protein UlMin_036864 [Ulmus minor]